MVLDLPTPADVDRAAARIDDVVRRTPLLTADVGGLRVVLKLEQLQVSGSFKIRGAANALRALSPRPTAVVAASGGNHGLAVAHAAAADGVAATIVVPESVPDEKARRLTASGASVVRHGDAYADAEAHARQLADAMDVPFVHAYADRDVVVGQGTVAREVRAQLQDDCDVLLVAVGGGGLLAGCATACRDSAIRVVGVEPEGIPTMRAALDAGAPVQVDVRSVTASALGARVTGSLNLEIAQTAVDDVVLVADEDILRARDLLWDVARVAAEPASPAGLAALLTGAVRAEAPCVVVCGANTAWHPQ